MQKPSIGRIVHYNAGTEDSPDWQAAIVAHVHNDTCLNLAVFDGNGESRSETSVTLGDESHSWRWPPRV